MEGTETQSAYGSGGGSAELELPPPAYGKALDDQASKDHASKVRRYLDSRILYEHPYRLWLHKLWRRAELFRQAQQWLVESYNEDPMNTPHWAPLEFDDDDPDAIPTPVFDEFSPPQENEAARLGKPEYEPYVRPDGDNPDLKRREGAKLAEQALNQGLENMRWTDEEDEGLHGLPLYGGWWTRSGWETTWKKTTRIGKQGAMKCPAEGCDFSVADPSIDPSLAEVAMATSPGAVSEERVSIGDDVQSRFKVTHCLTCQEHDEKQLAPITDEDGMPMLSAGGAVQRAMADVRVDGPPKLKPFTPVDDELNSFDHFGRPLWEDVPLGEWRLRTCSPYDVFPRNLGIDVKMADLDEIVYVYIATVDDVRARYPQKADKIKPEPVDLLQRFHPVAGARAIYYADGQGLFNEHLRVKELVRQPRMVPVYDEEGRKTGRWKMDRGRYTVMANNELLEDGDLFVESKTRPGVLLDRVRFDYVPWEFRSGGRELAGLSMSERQFEPQIGINRDLSMDQDALERTGYPRMIAPRDANMEYETIPGAGAHVLYDPSLVNPQAVPTPIQGIPGIPGIEAKLQYKQDYMARGTGTNEVEGGNLPPGIDSGAALQILADQSSEKRRPRIRRIRQMYMRQWSHGLRLMEEFVREPRKLWWQDDHNEWHERAWQGNQFEGQTTVRIDPEPEHDTDLVNRQNVRDGITTGVLNPQNPKAATKISRALNLPRQLREAEDMQDEAAEREFIDFLETGREPVVDTELDDSGAHYEQHGTDCHSPKWRTLEDSGQWDKALVVLWNWKDPTIPVPPPPLPPGAMPPVDAAGSPLPPPPPTYASRWDLLNEQAGEQWPAALELRIMACWLVLLTGKLQQTPEQEAALKKVLRFRAHMAAHKMVQDGVLTAAAAGAQITAAPQAGEETAAGTVAAAPAGAAPVPQGMM